MKQFICLLCLIIVSTCLYSQQFPTGSWNIVTDSKGNFIDPRNSVSGPRQVTSFDFKDGKYSFRLQDWDSLENKVSEVVEQGTYTVSAGKFVLSPSSSTTTFYEYIAKSSRPISNVSKQNSTSPAEYNWTYQKEGDPKLVIEAMNPGHREGLFSGAKTKSVARATRRSTPLSSQAVRAAVRAL